MAEELFDAIVVGAGQAGPAIAARCSREGLRTVVIERGLFGGTCVNVGCIPTKTMIASARAVHMARRGAEFGFSVADPRVDMAAVKARKDQIVLQSRTGVESWMRGLAGTEVITGEARFVAPSLLEVAGRRLRAPRIFLNLGARPIKPDLPGIETVMTLDNASIMELTSVPEHLIVVGGSYIGLEFAQMMRRFGAEVTVVERMARLVPREDEDVSECIRNLLEAEGVDVRVASECISLAQDGNGVSVGNACPGGDESIRGTHVLLAMGRRPNTDGVGLAAAGIGTDAHGYIQVDDQCRTSAPGVWAVGDCNGRGGFTHTSWNDHEIVVANLFDRDSRRISQRIPCYALFIDPPLGRAGVTDAQARSLRRPLLWGKLPMQQVGRAREMSETQGFMKVVVDAESRRLLGASVLGTGGDEVVHSLLDIMAAGQPYSTIARTMHIHPTVSELVPTLLQQLQPLA